MILFALSLPGLVVLIIALGAVQLVRAKTSGKKRPGSATSGIDLLDVILKPGSEHRLLEQESMKIKRNENESDARPFSEIHANGRRLTWKVPPQG